MGINEQSETMNELMSSLKTIPPFFLLCPSKNFPLSQPIASLE